jgi:ABC-2 type transport system permease protein
MRLSSASPSALPALLHRAWVQLRAPLRFRVDFFTSVLGNVMVMAVGGTLLATMFQHIPSLGGWTGWEVLFLWAWLETVIALAHFACAGLLVFNRRYLVNGELDRALLRPGDPLFGVLVDNLASEELPGLAVAASVLALAAWKAQLGWSALAIVPGVLGSLGVFASILTVFASLGFHVRHSGTAVGVVFQAASYARYPFDLYPRALRALLLLGMFGFLAYLPTSTLLGHTSVKMGGLHLTAAACSMTAAYVFFRFSLNKYSSSGT